MAGQTSIPSGVSAGREIVPPARPILAIVDRSSYRDYNLQQEASQRIVIAKVVDVGSNGRVLINVNGKTFPVTFDQNALLVKGDSIRVAIRMLDGRPLEGSRMPPPLASGSTIAAIKRELSPSVVTSLSNGGLTIGNLLSRLTDSDRLRIEVASIAFAEAKNKILAGIAIGQSQGASSEKALRSGLVEFILSSISNSGMFYESHLKEYLFGRRSKQNLLLEYQNIQKSLKNGVESKSDITEGGTQQQNGFLLSQISTLSKSAFRLTIEGLFLNPVDIDFEYHLAEGRDTGAQEDLDLSPWSITLRSQTDMHGAVEISLNCHVDHMLVKVACNEREVNYFRQSAESLKKALSSLTSMDCSLRVVGFDG